jgi:hypothetical protein
MCTAVVCLALSGFLGVSAVAEEPQGVDAFELFFESVIPEAPKWLDEYGKARQQGRKEEKPLAVFIGSGKSGWHQVVRDETLEKEVNRLLAQQYVCLYVNTDDEAGQRLAEAFDIPRGPGVVISNHSGGLQAFRHAGRLTNQDLERYLRRFADPDRATTQTETEASYRMSYYSAPSDPQSAPFYHFAPAFSGGRGC